jgi:hypothetical protein
MLPATMKRAMRILAERSRKRLILTVCLQNVLRYPISTHKDKRGLLLLD